MESTTEKTYTESELREIISHLEELASFFANSANHQHTETDYLVAAARAASYKVAVDSIQRVMRRES